MNASISERNRGRVVYAGEPEVAARYALNDIFVGAWLSHAITALARHGVPDLIGETPTAVETVAQQAHLHAPTLYRVLRAAAANGIFQEHENGMFAHTAISKLLRSDHPFSWKGMACMWNHPSCLQAWSRFGQCLEDGASGIQHAFGKTLYEHLGETPGATHAFSQAMISNTAHTSISIAREFPFSDYKVVMDLAGGIGTLLCTILEIHSQLKGVLYEIDELKAEAEQYIQARGLASRLKFETGDFIKNVPSGADLFMVKNSLWNWPDEQCLAILRNVRVASARNEGRLLIIEYVIDAQNSAWTTLYDLQILNMPGGRARTLAEYRDLLSRSGFAVEQVQHIEDQTLVLARPC
jgi:hypothetical protein